MQTYAKAFTHFNNLQNAFNFCVAIQDGMIEYITQEDCDEAFAVINKITTTNNNLHTFMYLENKHIAKAILNKMRKSKAYNVCSMCKEEYTYCKDALRTQYY
jgi:hypothetical protein